jgi:hypothetical protein
VAPPKAFLCIRYHFKNKACFLGIKGPILKIADYVKKISLLEGKF